MNRLLVFTDLDATLLDRETYSWREAMPALQLIRQLQIPLILNSSKTIAEMVPLAVELDTRAPLVAENGSVIAMPGVAGESYPSNRQIVLGRRYEDIIFTLQQLREKHDYRFRGFHDLDADEISALTGLSPATAALARARKGTEPVLWEEDEKRLGDFRTQLDKHGLSLTKGGRFFHVASKQNKAQALRWLRDYYAESYPDDRWTCIALGDSANDFAMLMAADLAVYLGPRPIPDELTSNISELIVATNPGPKGWNAAMLSLLREQQGETIS